MNIHQFFTKTKNGIAAVTLILSINSIEANGQKETVAKLSRYEVSAATKNEFMRVVKDYVHYSLDLKNNIISEAYYEIENANVIWIIERWSSRAAFEEAIRSKQFLAISAFSVTGVLESPESFYVNDLEPLSKKQWRIKEKAGDEALTVMLFVDSKPGTEDRFKKIYHDAMPLFRSEAGVINYQLSQLDSDKTKFVTYEKFRNEDAFQYHLNFPPIKPILDYLNTDIQSQPFQKGLHKLIAFASLSTR